MKTKETRTKKAWSFTTVKLLATMLCIVATLALIGCKKDEPDPCTCNPKDHLQEGETCNCGGEGCNCTVEQEVATEIILNFEGFDVTINYKKKKSENVPAHITRLETAVKYVFINTDTDFKSTIDAARTRGGIFNINVIYDVNDYFIRYRAVDGRTIEVHDSWLLTDTSQDTAFIGRVGVAFDSMLAIVDVDENGVPYYGVLPNTAIKIYKGEGVTDEQMTSAIEKIIQAYNGDIVFGGMIDDFGAIIDSVLVKSGTEIIRKENVVEVGLDATRTDIGTYFVMIGWGMA